MLAQFLQTQGGVFEVDVPRGVLDKHVYVYRLCQVFGKYNKKKILRSGSSHAIQNVDFIEDSVVLPVRVVKLSSVK